MHEVRTSPHRPGRLRPRAVGAALLATAFVAVPAATATAQAAPVITRQVVESFDGTPIVTTLFLPPGADDDAPVPLVLRTHGWGGTGETTVGGTLEVLLDEGYAVLTWDQRGFGCSGGTVAVDKPDLEGRDASALIDWAVANAPIATDGAGDPLVGFTGGSYAGGIQTATSSMDPRVDAIAPEISWTDLRYSLYAGGVPNQGWGALLTGAGLPTATGLGLSPDCLGFTEYGPQTGTLDPIIVEAFTTGATLATIGDEALDFFAASSLASYGQDDPVAIPTLVMNGSVDTLFDLTDGWGIVEHVAAQGAPTKFIAFCGGHVACPGSYEDAGDRGHLDEAIVAWFDRYLRGDTSVDTGPAVEVRTNTGAFRAVDDFFRPDGAPALLTGAGSGALTSVPTVEFPDPDALAAQLADLSGGGLPGTPLTVAQPSLDGDPRALVVEVAEATDGPIELVGIPEVTLTVEGTGPTVTLFAKYVDREAGEVVNLQEGPVAVPLGDGPTTVDVPMPGLAYTLPEGHHLDLQVSTASLMHINARTPAQVDVEATTRVPVEAAPAAAPMPTDPPSATPTPLPTPTPPDGPDVPSPAEPGPDRPAPAPVPSEVAAPAPSGPTLPATGASLPLLVPLGAVVVAATRRRRR